MEYARIPFWAWLDSDTRRFSSVSARWDTQNQPVTPKSARFDELLFVWGVPYVDWNLPRRYYIFLTYANFMLSFDRNWSKMALGMKRFDLARFGSEKCCTFARQKHKRSMPYGKFTKNMRCDLRIWNLFCNFALSFEKTDIFWDVSTYQLGG